EDNVERFDARVEPEALELGEEPLGVVLVVRRADVVRAGRQPAHVLAQRVGRRDRAELGLPLALGLRRLSREAAQIAGGGGREAEQGPETERGQRTGGQAHERETSYHEVRRRLRREFNS